MTLMRNKPFPNIEYIYGHKMTWSSQKHIFRQKWYQWLHFKNIIDTVKKEISLHNNSLKYLKE